MKELIAFIASRLVDHPDDVKTSLREEEGCVTIELRVAKDDLGKVIGKQGRTARAMRTVLATAAAREEKRSRLEIVE
ncbi:KH domain-containing protein [Thermodesulfobacteriota bacterium B35]